MISLLILQLLLPNPVLTPGVGVSLTLDQLCPETAVLTQVPLITPVVRSKVLLHYKLTRRREYYIDFLIPLELGGTIDVKNLWPMYFPIRDETLKKKVLLEHELHNLVCNQEMTLEEAQKHISFDWTLAYTRFVERQ